MKKLLKTAIVSLILLTSSAYAITREEFVDMHDARIIERCEDENITWDHYRRNEMAIRMLRIPRRYECGLVQLYALRKNAQHQIDINDEDAWKVFSGIMEENYIEEFDTYDFEAVNIAYEKWLEDQDK